MTNVTATYLSAQEDTIWLAVHVSESIMIVIINGLTLIAFARNSHLRKRSTYLIINLTVADLLVGLVTVPLDVYWREFGYETTLSWRYFSTTIAYDTCSMSSLVNLCLLSMERLHATLYPFAHCLIRERFFFKTIVCSWLLSLLLASVDTALYLYIQSGSSYLWTSLIVVTLLTLSVSYVIIIIKIKSTPHPYPGGTVASDRKLSVTLFIVTTVSVMTILPYAIYSTLRFDNNMWKKVSSAKQFYIRLSAHALYYNCSLVNPLIYSIRMQAFRRAVYKPLICCKSAISSRVQPIVLHAM